MDTPPLPAANPYAATPPPPLPNKDVGHLKTLAICHYVVAGLSILGLGFLALHYTIMNSVFGNAEMWDQMAKQQPQPMPFKPEEFMDIFKWFYLVFGIITVVGGILTFLSGRCISQRKSRTFSMIIAGLSCLTFPGIVLGIFTLIVLARDSVVRLYAEAETSRNAAGN